MVRRTKAVQCYPQCNIGNCSWSKVFGTTQFWFGGNWLVDFKKEPRIKLTYVQFGQAGYQNSGLNCGVKLITKKTNPSSCLLLCSVVERKHLDAYI